MSSFTTLEQALARIAELEMENAELKADSEALRRLSRRDGLTDLLNRRGGMEEWQAACHEAMRRNEPISVVFIDLKEFKAVNDTYGQPTGDKVLQAVAGVLRGKVRRADKVVRPGGDEFVLILPRTDDAGCRLTVERVTEGLNALHVKLNGHGELNGIRARFATATEMLPRTTSPLGMWDDVGTRIKADKSLE